MYSPSPSFRNVEFNLKKQKKCFWNKKATSPFLSRTVTIVIATYEVNFDPNIIRELILTSNFT